MICERVDDWRRGVVYLGAVRDRATALAHLDLARELAAQATAEGYSGAEIDAALAYAFRDVGRAEGIRTIDM